MTDVAVRTEHLGKEYGIGRPERYQTFREALMQTLARPFRWDTAGASQEKFWALRDVSLAIQCGEAVGVIGRNGAGKSTLLKILSRITEPTEGYADIWGRVGSLLEVGTGFHQELTGRENIYLNGAILGMRRLEIRRKLDEIVAFSEVEQFLDTPVKRYSSGMYLRLAFAVAAHLETEVLMVDEVLAVGDAGFQRKCLGKMSEVARQNRTIIFVSHNMSAIAQLCGRAIWIDQGCVRMDGPPSQIIGAYLASGSTGQAVWTNESGFEAETRVDSVRLKDAQESSRSVFEFDQGFRVELRYTVAEAIRDLSMLCRVTDAQGNIVWTSWDTDTTAWAGRVRAVGRYVSVCEVPAELLRPGRYFLSVGSTISRIRLVEYYEHVLTFDISEVGYTLNLDRMGVITPVLRWLVEAEDEAAEDCDLAPRGRWGPGLRKI